MNTNYNDEETRFEEKQNENVNETPKETAEENEDTQLEETTDEEEVVEEATVEEEKEKSSVDKKKLGKEMAIGAGSGLLIGGLSTFLMGMKADPKQEEPTNHKEELSHPEWVDDKVPVATGVNDEMSFGQAFAAARQEVGPGGCFEWRGQLYGTYTAEEWNKMSPEERHEYASHFSWNKIDSHDSPVHKEEPVAVHHDDPDDEIEVISVEHPNEPTVAQHNEPQENHVTPGHGPQVVEVNDPEPSPNPDPAPANDPEIEIIGVVHDEETGANIGGMLVDGQEVVLVDVDNDIVFDYMVVDANHNGKIDEGEVIDISDQNLTVNDLGGFTNPNDGLMANDDNLGLDESNPIEC